MDKMTCEEFYELLDDIKKRPGIYIGTKSLTGLRHFIDGIFYGLYYMNGQKEYPDYLQGFQEWIQIKFDITSSHHWSSIINFYSNDEANAFDLFYELLEEFLSLDKEIRDYKKILEDQEKWMQLKSEYLNEYHKILFHLTK